MCFHKRIAATLLAFAVALCAAPALATPGDAAAVIAHCGAPSSDIIQTSEATNLPERVLTYGSTRMDFRELNGAAGWSFTGGWLHHIPAEAGAISRSFPCFGDGLEEASIRYQNSMATRDPAVAGQSLEAAPQHGAFGISHLWLIVGLVGIILVFALLLPRRRKLVNGPDPTIRPFRRPRLESIRMRRRPRIDRERE